MSRNGSKLESGVPNSIDEAVHFLDFVLNIEGKQMRFAHYLIGVQTFLRNMQAAQQQSHTGRPTNGRMKETAAIA
jgi:hypothetical protein